MTVCTAQPHRTQQPTSSTWSAPAPSRWRAYLSHQPPAKGRSAETSRRAGLEVLLKTYVEVYCWKRASSAEALFASPPETLPYVPEPQGEAIA